jgi:amino acid permease
MAGASVLPGVVIILAVILVNIWTIVILIHAAERHQQFNLGALLRLLPGRLGPAAQLLTDVSIWFTIYLTLVGYIDAIHDSSLLLLPKDSWLAQGRLPLTGCASLIVLPLCFLDQKYLSFTSILGILANVNLLTFIFVTFGQRAASDNLGKGSCIFGFGKGTLTMVSTATNSIIIQMCILPMYEALENRSPERYTKVLLLAFACLGVLLSIFAIVAYLVVGPPVEGNVLKNFPPKTFWASATQVGMIVVIFAVYPIFLMPMVAPLRALDPSWFLRSGPHEEGDRASLPLAESRRGIFVGAVTVVIVAAAFVGAVFVPDLGIINALNGSVEVGVFTAMGPGLVGLYLLDNSSLVWKTSVITLLAMGVVFFVLGLVFTDNYVSGLACSWNFNAMDNVSVLMTMSGIVI